MFWTLLKYAACPSEPDLGVVIVRLLGFSQYETGEVAHQAWALDDLPAMNTLVVLVRDIERPLKLRPEHLVDLGRPFGSLVPPLLDRAASGVSLLIPDLAPDAVPPTWFPAALERLPDLFMPRCRLPPGAVCTVMIPPASD